MKQSSTEQEIIGNNSSDLIEVSFYEEGMETEIVELLNSVFDRWPKHEIQCKPVDHWRWKYTDNPSGKYIITIAKINNRIIGCNHTTFTNISLFNKKNVTILSADTATHLDYRGKGVQQRMDKLWEKSAESMRYSISYWITSNPIYIEWASRHKSTQLPVDLDNMIWINDIGLYLKERKPSNQFAKKLGYTLYKTGIQLLSSNEKPINDCTVKTVKRFDSSADLFWDQIREHYDFIFVRDKASLNHRYCDPRAGKYTVLGIFRGKSMLGFCVLGQEKVKGNIDGKIVDFIVLPEEPGVGDILLKNALNHFIETKINCVNFWFVKNNWLENIFKRNHFISRSKGIPHLFFEDASSVPDWDKLQDSSPDRIHFVMGDTDFN
jgi:hypothetical protein